MCSNLHIEDGVPLSLLPLLLMLMPPGSSRWEWWWWWRWFPAESSSPVHSLDEAETDEQLLSEATASRTAEAASPSGMVAMGGSPEERRREAPSSRATASAFPRSYELSCTQVAHPAVARALARSQSPDGQAGLVNQVPK